jgi:hypothetical protein
MPKILSPQNCPRWLPHLQGAVVAVRVERVRRRMAVGLTILEKDWGRVSIGSEMKQLYTYLDLDLLVFDWRSVDF